MLDGRNGWFRVCAMFLFVAILLAWFSCAMKINDKDNTVLTNGQLIALLGDKTQYLALGAQNGPQLIITPELSGRVLGASFSGEAGENLLWVDKTIIDGSYFKTRPYYWNAGGHRTWVAPEDLFFIAPDSTWVVPAQLDPAPFRLIEKTDFGATYEADVNLKTNIDKYFQLTINRRIGLLDTPPAEVRDTAAGVKYVGIDLTHTLTNRSEQVIGVDMPYVCLWNLIQLNPSGTTLVPLADDADTTTAYREYFNPLGHRLVLKNNIISIKIDGKYRCKVGIRPEAARRGIVYLRDDKDGTGVLYALMFSVDPQGIYVDKPWGSDSPYGDAIELYNDDGNMGGFTEVECHGPARALNRGESQSHTAVLHMFGGNIETLKQIGSRLMDADLTKAYYF